VAVLAWWLSLLPGADDHATPADGDVAPRRRALLLVAPLALLAICGTVVEEVGNSWAALYTRDALGAAPGVAGLAYVTAYAAQFVGRLLGDPMTDRLGRLRTAGIGGVLIAAGGLVTMLAPDVAVGLTGFVLLGLGCATLVPAAFAAAHDLPGLPYGTGVALVTWLMRAGFLLTSPIFGAVADQAGLRAGMALPVIAGVGAVLITALWLRPARTTLDR
jgi:MFS family permease